MTRIAKNYADALYELARDEALDEQIYGQLRGIRELLEAEPEYVRLLSAPNLPKPERLAALDEAFSGRVHPYLLSFLKLLCERGHIRELHHSVSPPPQRRSGYSGRGGDHRRSPGAGAAGEAAGPAANADRIAGRSPISDRSRGPGRHSPGI